MEGDDFFIEIHIFGTGRLDWWEGGEGGGGGGGKKAVAMAAGCISL